jgi:hypothetical protein
LVEVEGERLSVKAGDVPLRDLFGEIQRKSGIVFDIKDSQAAAKRAFVGFDNLSPTLAVREILQDLNFALFYSETRLERVLILPPVDRIPKANEGLIKPTSFGPWLSRANNVPFQPGAKSKLPAEKRKGSDVTAKLDAIEAMEDSDDPKSIAALGEALSDQNRRVKEAALQALANKKEAAATELLRRGLNDADTEFCIQVLEILARRGDVDSLRKAVADRNRDVRETAVHLLVTATAR